MKRTEREEAIRLRRLLGWLTIAVLVIGIIGSILLDAGTTENCMFLSAGIACSSELSTLGYIGTAIFWIASAATVFCGYWWLRMRSGIKNDMEDEAARQADAEVAEQDARDGAGWA
jgi:hypothetical protein